jgi:hypothetical protein
LQAPAAGTGTSIALREHALVLCLFVGLVALYTWPLAADPAHLLPDNHDPRLYAWVMPTVFRNLLTQPAQLFHGNAFYPIGNSLTFAESLLTPSLVGGPLYFLTGNPILAYNLTLLFVWALSGWAMYAVTFWVTEDRAAAFAAAAIFALCPVRTDYYVEFQIETMFGIPLAIYALVRFFEERRVRHLVAFLAVFWVQAVAVQYYAVILGLGIAFVALECLALCWGGWPRRTLGALAVGLLALGLGLVPTGRAYLLTRRELGFERSLEDAAGRGADLLTYLHPRSNWLYGAVPLGVPGHETTLFLGFVALALAGLGLLWLRDHRRPSSVADRLLAGGMGACLALGVLGLFARGRVAGGLTSRPALVTLAGLGLLALVLVREALDGWRGWRLTAEARRLRERDWVGLLLGLAVFAILLSLGPIVHVRGRQVGAGLEGWLYAYLLPLRAVRFVTRFGILAMFAGAFLAGFGVKRLRVALPPRVARPVIGGLILLLLLEYGRTPLEYEHLTAAARPVDRAIHTDPADIAVLEVPTNVAKSDADAMFRSLAHGKDVVNGFAGFEHEWLQELSGAVSAAGPPFPDAHAEALLRRIYPLRYLVIRLEDPDLDPASRSRWLTMRQAAPPLLHFRGSFDDVDLYEVRPLPERGRTMERWMAYAYLRRNPSLQITLRPLRADEHLDQWVEVRLNRRPVERLGLSDAVSATLALSGPLAEVAPNVLTLHHGYRRRPDARSPAYRIGETAMMSAVDMVIASAGQPHGDRASIVVAGREAALNHRGYNLVAVDSSGAVLSSVVFDTFGVTTAGQRLAAWVGGLPAGTIVAGAVKDEASRLLTAEAVSGLDALGVAGDLRNRFRESHAFIGAKGAPRGTAIEAMGPRPVTVAIGESEPGLGFELLELAPTSGVPPFADTDRVR